MGRPKGPRSRLTVSLWLTVETREWLRRSARGAGGSVGAYLNELVTANMEAEAHLLTRTLDSPLQGRAVSRRPDVDPD